MADTETDDIVDELNADALVWKENLKAAAEVMANADDTADEAQVYRRATRGVLGTFLGGDSVAVLMNSLDDDVADHKQTLRQRAEEELEGNADDWPPVSVGDATPPTVDADETDPDPGFPPLSATDHADDSRGDGR